MVLLVHHPVSPFSRKIRIMLAEKKILFVLREESPWNLSDELLKLNPSGSLPVFLFDGNVVAGNYAISEFLEETCSDVKLLPQEAIKRAETRRLCEWFDDKFFADVYKNIVSEKIYKRFVLNQTPNSKILKLGLSNLAFHLEYLDWLAERRNYIAGDEFSLADISAASQISVIDYLGDVPWDGYKNAKIWYSKIKSRPSFKDILKDTIKGILPAKHYANLDF